MRCMSMLVWAAVVTTVCASIVPPADGQSAWTDRGRRQRSATTFETDARLEAKMTQRPGEWRVFQIWNAVTRRTKVRIEREDGAGDIEEGTIAGGWKGVSARAVMDAVAAFYVAPWERTERNSYRLLVPDRERDFTFSAKSDWERQRFAIGREFIRSLERLSPEERSRVDSGRSQPFSALPPEMQQQALGMLEQLELEYRSRGVGTSAYGRDLAGATFRLERKPARDFNRLFLTIKVPDVGSTGFRINDYEEKKRQREAARTRRAGGGPDALYTPVKFEVKPEDARQLPELRRKVEIKLERGTFTDVLQHLHRNHGIAYLASPAIAMPKTARVRLPLMPLHEALDRLTAIFPDTEWEWRRYGFLLVRGPRNPARGPSRGQFSSGGAPASHAPAPELAP